MLQSCPKICTKGHPRYLYHLIERRFDIPRMIVSLLAEEDLVVQLHTKWFTARVPAEQSGHFQLGIMGATVMQDSFTSWSVCFGCRE